jgi:hypothetical protein
VNWSDIASTIGKVAPVIGTLVGGPAGAAIGGLVSMALGVENTPAAVQAAIATDPDAALKLQQLQLDHAKDMQTLVVQAESNRLTAETQQRAADSADLVSVNTTMQAESAAHVGGFNNSWRAMCGYVVAFSSALCVIAVCVLFGVALITHQTAALTVIPELASAIALILTIPGAAVGITAWHAGRAQTIQAATASPPPAVSAG